MNYVQVMDFIRVITTERRALFKVLEFIDSHTDYYREIASEEPE